MPLWTHQLAAGPVAAALREALPGAVIGEHEEWVEIASDRILDVLRWLHDSPEYDAAQLSNLTSVDRHTYFEVVYHLQSLDLNHMIAVKAIVEDHEDPVLPSAYPVYKGALLQEREVYDLMGIRFDGHPDLRRLFLWDGFPAHPLRKDFMGLGSVTPGLARFPFENKQSPDRLMNVDNLMTPDDEHATAPQGQSVEPEGH